MHTTYYIILVLSTLLFATLMLAAAYMLFTRMAIFDTPNERSNHKNPVPTGAGIAFMIPLLGFLVVVNASGNIIWPALMLTLVSFLDDQYSLPIMKRLGFQAIAVIIGVNAIHGSPLQGLLPQWAELTVCAVVWMWFINLYNFMDGIDEITVTQTGSIMAGLLVLGLLETAIPRAISIDATVVLASVVAFWPWNRHPARMFMGDAGSIPLGFLVCYALFNLAGAGYWQAALILPAYYLSDATLTLLKRAAARKPVWQAHSEHYYQQAVRGGHSHEWVSRQVLLLNAILIALAVVSLFDPIAALVCVALAYTLCGVWLYRFTLAPGAQAHEVAA